MAEFGAQSCSASGCPVHDFLPYTCPACKNVFCSDHLSISAHHCDEGQAFLSSRGGDGSGRWIAEESKRHLLSSRKPSEVMAAAASRFEGRDVELTSGGTHYNIKAPQANTASAWGAPDKALKKAQESVSKASTEKARRMSKHVHRMLVKSKAIGNTKLRMEDRFFLELRYWGNDEDVHHMFFSRLWTVGRTVDEIVRTRRRFLRLKPGEEALLLELAKVDAENALPTGGILHNLSPDLQSFDVVIIRPRVLREARTPGTSATATSSSSAHSDQKPDKSASKSEETRRGITDTGTGSWGAKVQGLTEAKSECETLQGASTGSSVPVLGQGDASAGLNITVGYGKAVHNLNGLARDLTVLDVKRRLEPLTGVPFVRQKLVFKGILRDADLLCDTRIVEGAKIMLLGTPGSERSK